MSLFFFKIFIPFMVPLMDFSNCLVNDGKFYLYQTVILEALVVSERSLSLENA